MALTYRFVCVVLAIVISSLGLVAQSNFPEILEDPIYESITAPDLEYDFDSLPKYLNEGAIIPLNFPHPFFYTDRIHININSLSLNGVNGALKQLVITPYTIKSGDASISGYPSWDEVTKVKIKYTIENGEPHTLVEINDVFFENFPESRYNYQAQFFSDGSIKVHYGPNNFSPNHPLYTDIATEVLFYDDEIITSFFLIAESPSEPKVYNHFTNPNITMEFAQDSIHAFNYFPDEVLAFRFNMLDAVTSVKESGVIDNSYLVTNLLGQLTITPENANQIYSVQVIGLNGQIINEQERRVGEQSIDLHSASSKIIIVRIKDTNGGQIQKIFLD